MKHLLAALGICTFFAATAYAQDSPNPATAGPGAVETGGEVSIGLGIGKIDEDWFITSRIGFGLQLPVPRIDCPPTECMTALRFGVQVPLNWRIVDNEPKSDGTIRSEDWDEVSDYFKILRFVEYGNPNEPLHARVGELGPVTVGHGTIVNGYLNVLSPDAFKWGLHTNLNTVYGGAQVLINNFVDPTIVGVRTYVRPWGFIDRESFLHRLAIGLSVVTDNSAPLELRRDADGVIAVEAGVAPIVEEETWTTFTGLDLEFNVLDTEMLSVTPYTDFNVHWGQSPGYHLGTLVRIAPLESLQLATRLEFRWLGQNYLPDYFGTLYEIDRFQFRGWGADVAAPKLRIAANRTGGSVVGMYGDVSANILGVATIFGSYADYQGPDNGSIRLRLDLARVGPVQLGAFWAKDGFDNFSDMIDLDGALLVGEARYYVAGPAYVRADYARTWRLVDDGTYESIDAWSVGGGVSFQF